MTVVICALGTGCGSPNAPTPTPSPRLPPPPGTVAVGTRGRVIDVDSGHPIAGANVTTVSVCYRDSEPAGGRCHSIDQPARATADENGVFLLTVSLPSTWNALSLKAAKSGYETSASKGITPSTATDAVLEVYPTLTIRPGESIETRLSRGGQVCGWLSANCRRIVVESPAGESVDVEVISNDTPDREVGLHADGDVFEDHGWPRRLTVLGGEVWIIAEPSVPLTLTARRH
jgi:hypothetical protein